MKKVFYVSLLFYACTAQAQNFHPGLTLSPALTGNFLHNDGSVPGSVEDNYKALENTTFGYYGYLFVQYARGPRVSWRLGAGYAQTGYATRRTKLIFAQPEPGAPEYVYFTFYHRDLMIPLLCRYNLTRHKNNLYLTAGLTPMLKLSRLKTLHNKYADGHKTTQQEEDTLPDYRPVNLDGTFGIGYDWQIGAKMHLFVQPTFDCNLLGEVKSAGLNRKIYSLGLNAGFWFGR